MTFERFRLSCSTKVDCLPNLKKKTKEARTNTYHVHHTNHPSSERIVCSHVRPLPVRKSLRIEMSDARKTVKISIDSIGWNSKLVKVKEIGKLHFPAHGAIFTFYRLITGKFFRTADVITSLVLFNESGLNAGYRVMVAYKKCKIPRNYPGRLFRMSR